jgi:hypothetical protein
LLFHVYKGQVQFPPDEYSDVAGDPLWLHIPKRHDIFRILLSAVVTTGVLSDVVD